MEPQEQNKTDKMGKEVWIRLTFITASQLEGEEELVNELDEVCIVQTPKKHLPAFCSGFEFIADLYLNVTLEEFIKNVVITGLAWDGTKAVFAKIWAAFKKFLERNESFDLQRLQLNFNDAVIRINGVSSYGLLLRLYQSFPHHFEVFRKNGLTEISLIRLPYIEKKDEETGRIKMDEPDFDTPEEEYLWRVEYLNGCDVCYYKPATGEFVD